MYMICKYILLITFLNESKLIFSAQLNCSKYWYVSQTIQLNISYFLHKLSNSSISNNSI